MYVTDKIKVDEDDDSCVLKRLNSYEGVEAEFLHVDAFDIPPQSVIRVTIDINMVFE